MRAIPHITDLTWSFLRAITLWSLMVAVAVAVGSCVLLRDPTFTFTFALAATFDVGTLWLVTRDARLYIEHDGSAAGRRLGVSIGGRLAVKGILLLVAALMPDVFSFLGMALGVLLVDTTVLIIGSVAAALKMPALHAAHSPEGK